MLWTSLQQSICHSLALSMHLWWNRNKTSAATLQGTYEHNEQCTTVTNSAICSGLFISATLSEKPILPIFAPTSVQLQPFTETTSQPDAAAARGEEAAFDFLTFLAAMLAVMQFLVLSTVRDVTFLTFTVAVSAVVTIFRLSPPTSGIWLKHGYSSADFASFHRLSTMWQRIRGVCMAWWTAAAPLCWPSFVWQRTWGICLAWWDAVPSMPGLSLHMEITKVRT